ncbi:hypothetical protein X975_08656, partial [Stegodyphus mimosarum]
MNRLHAYLKYLKKIESSCLNQDRNDGKNKIDGQENRKIKWIIDSGATSHMATSKEIFTDFKDEEQQIMTSEKDAMIKSVGIGNIKTQTDRIKNILRVENVLQVPNLSENLLFGCEAYVHIIRQKRRKMDLKAQKGIMIGYSMKRKAYEIYIPELNKIQEMRDVKFNEQKLGSPLLKENYLKFNKNQILEELIIFYKEQTNGSVNNAGITGRYHREANTTDEAEKILPSNTGEHAENNSLEMPIIEHPQINEEPEYDSHEYSVQKRPPRATKLPEKL